MMKVLAQVPFMINKEMIVSTINRGRRNASTPLTTMTGCTAGSCSSHKTT